MDKIRINNLKFYTYNGVLPEEKKLGQQLEIDLELRLDLKKPGQSDDVKDTVNYAEVNEIIKKRVTEHSYNLIEACAAAILADIEQTYQVDSAQIKIRKYSVPMPGVFDNIEIELEREFAK